MKRQIAVIVAGFFGLVLILMIGVVVLTTLVEPELFSPPTASRDIPSMEDEWLGVLEGPDRGSIDSEPVGTEMGVPDRMAGTGDDFLLEWRDGAVAADVELPDRWVAGLAPGESCELVAFASWYPQADDALGADAAPWAEPVFRDPTALEEIGSAELDRLGVPAAFRRIPTTGNYQTPRLRLVFRAEGVEHPRILTVAGGDAVTRFQVTYPLKGIDELNDYTGSEGGWIYFDSALLAWHSVELDLVVGVLTGTPVYADLPREVGGQVVIGDRARAMWLGTTGWEFDLNSSIRQFAPAPSVPESDRDALARRMDRSVWGAWIEPESPRVERPQMLMRVSSREYFWQHVGRLGEGGRAQWAWRPLRGSNVDLVSAADPEAGSVEPVRLVMVPDVAELRFVLAGLPDAPTPGRPEDLFDVRFSRITLSEDVGRAEQQVVGFVSVAAQLAWDYNSLWEDLGGLPAGLPSDRTLRDLTARQLLQWYLDQTPGATLRYDEKSLTLNVNEEPWTFAEWWDEYAPDWLDF